jgi:hypothetical protein
LWTADTTYRYNLAIDGRSNILTPVYAMNIVGACSLVELVVLVTMTSSLDRGNIALFSSGENRRVGSELLKLDRTAEVQGDLQSS